LERKRLEDKLEEELGGKSEESVNGDEETMLLDIINAKV
jgi:hypothetical protein